MLTLTRTLFNNGHPVWWKILEGEYFVEFKNFLSKIFSAGNTDFVEFSELLQNFLIQNIL